MDDTFTFGQRVKMHRIRLGMSQAELGEKIGLKYTAISNWEVGKTYPTAQTLPALASVLRVSIDELMGHTPPSYSEKTYTMLAGFEDLDDASQDFIINMMETLPHRPGK